MDLTNATGDGDHSPGTKGECEPEIREFVEAEIQPVRSPGERRLPAPV